MILIVEDSSDRSSVFLDCFKDNCLIVATYKGAVAALKKQAFDEIWLDHDIIGNKNGCDVAFWIATKLDKLKLPKQIYVHSWNHAGALAIKQTLNCAGINCVIHPFEKSFVNKIAYSK